MTKNVNPPPVGSHYSSDVPSYTENPKPTQPQDPGPTHATVRPPLSASATDAARKRALRNSSAGAVGESPPPSPKYESSTTSRNEDKQRKSPFSLSRLFSGSRAKWGGGAALAGLAAIFAPSIGLSLLGGGWVMGRMAITSGVMFGLGFLGYKAYKALKSTREDSNQLEQ